MLGATIMEPINDPLWEIAKKRAKFKKNLISYLVIIPFLWAIWYFSGPKHLRFYDMDNSLRFYIPWPAWVMLGWGFGLVLKFVDAYVFNSKNSVETEYEKLKNKQ